MKGMQKCGVRKLGIPTVTDRIIQQAIAQVLTPIYKPKFSEGSYGYRPNRSAKDAIQKVKEYADDIILLAKSIRAAERLLGTSTEYLEKKLKLKVNTEKSRAVSVNSIRNFGFSALQWEGTERVHIWNSGNEKHDGRMERVAASKNTDV